MKTEFDNTENEALNKTDVMHSVLLPEHLAPYLPYKLRCLIKDEKIAVIDTLQAIYNNAVRCECTFFNIVESQKGFDVVKPILRPLSDIHCDMLFEGKTIIPSEEISKLRWVDFYKGHYLQNKNGYKFDVICLPYFVINKLIKYHFDINDLIGKNLAISVHDVELHCA